MVVCFRNRQSHLFNGINGIWIENMKAPKVVLMEFQSICFIKYDRALDCWSLPCQRKNDAIDVTQKRYDEHILANVCPHGIYYL